MSKISSYELTQEFEKESRRPKGQGDGWTLDQHLIEHKRMATWVSIKDSPEILIVSHITPGRRKFWVALAGVIGGIIAVWAMGLVPPITEFGVVQIAIAIGTLALLVASIYASFAHTRMGINKIGLIARPWPPVPGLGVAVPLNNIRRFKVNKPGEGDSKKFYELIVLTKDDNQHIIVPNIPLKRDAYLLAMLLIDKVKKYRGGLGNR
ncbi:MAG: hypothetical protein AAGA25_11160 [Planctomycetota bacterium]